MNDRTPKYPLRRVLLSLGLASGLGCSSGDGTTEPSTLSLEINPTSLTITRGESATISVTIHRGGDVTSPLELALFAAPGGVTYQVTNLQTAGEASTASIIISTDGTVIPGTYDLYVRGKVPGVTVRADLGLIVTWRAISCPPPGILCEQWATGAVASSEYSADDWSALRATGEPDAQACTDDPRAWASLDPGGSEWLEVTYQEGLRPTEIRVYETFGVSSIVKVEVRTTTGAYHTVYTAQAQSHDCPRDLTIPVTGITVPVTAVRLTIDQAWLNLGWSEIDAVALVGAR